MLCYNISFLWHSYGFLKEGEPESRESGASVSLYRVDKQLEEWVEGWQERWRDVLEGSEVSEDEERASFCAICVYMYMYIYI